MLPEFSYVRPEKIEQAVKYLAKGKASVHAGGTDLLGCLREGIVDSGLLVSISGIRGMTGIKESLDGGLKIGALTTITEVAENPLVRARYPGLAQGASEVASPQLRNQGTIGGNLCQKPRCWYFRGEFNCLRKGGDRCYALKGENRIHAIFGHDNTCAITHPSDIAPVLAALRAKVDVLGSKGKRTIAVEDLHVLPAKDVQAETVLDQGEVITHITVPAPSLSLYTSYRKIRARRSWDFALSGVALALVMDGDRVASGKVFLSGVAPVPWRSIAAEKILTGSRLSGDTISKAAQSAVKGAEPLSDNRYKIDMVRGMLFEELHKVGKTGTA